MAPETQTCPNCQKIIKAGLRVCSYCKQSVNEQAPQQATALDQSTPAPVAVEHVDARQVKTEATAPSFCSACGAAIPVAAGFCSSCGKATSPEASAGVISMSHSQAAPISTPVVIQVQPSKTNGLRIATGVISLVLMFIVGIQSLIAVAGGSLAASKSMSNAGAGGLFVAFLLLLGGAFSFGLPLVGAIILLLAGIIAVPIGLSSPFQDLAIWGVLCLILGVLDFFAWRIDKKRKRVAMTLPVAA
jgi:RNA polymerase subunit RPABC4/transcription elongation factor Spt4